MKRAIVNCHMVDVKRKIIKPNMTIVWENSKISKIGQQVDVHDCSDVIDAVGNFVTPGLINGYSHLGLKEMGVRWEGNDVHEASGLVQPSLSVTDGIYPFDKGFEIARSTGITTANICTRPENIIGGLTSIIKTYGRVIDEMIISKDQGLSVSLGDIPKQAYFNQTKKALTRMGIASNIRKKFKSALYNSNEGCLNEEERIFKSVLKREMPLYICAHRADDILRAVWLTKAFNIKTVRIGATEAMEVLGELDDENISVLIGPFYKSKTRGELKKLSPINAVKLGDANIEFGIVTPNIRNLPLEGSLSERAGLPNIES